VASRRRSGRSARAPPRPTDPRCLGTRPRRPSSLVAAVGDSAGDSIGAASGIAARLGGDAGQALTAAANRAFVHAMDVTVLVGAGVALAGALVAVLCLPARARQPAVSRSGP
jgi:hypothetical protein